MGIFYIQVCSLTDKLFKEGHSVGSDWLIQVSPHFCNSFWIKVSIFYQFVCSVNNFLQSEFLESFIITLVNFEIKYCNLVRLCEAT